MESVSNVKLESPLNGNPVVEAKTSLGGIALGIVGVANILLYCHKNFKTQRERYESDWPIVNIAAAATISAAAAAISGIAVVVLSGVGLTASTVSLPLSASVCLLGFGAGVAYQHWRNHSQKRSWW